VNRQDLNPIAATRDDYEKFQDLSRPVQAWRFVRWGMIYLMVLGVIMRAISWMVLVPLWEREVKGTDRTLQGRLRILTFGPPVTDAATSAKVLAQTGTALVGLAVLSVFGAVPTTVGPLERGARIAIIVLWAGFLIGDPVWCVAHKLNQRRQ
jgi:hypothetical protein